MLNYACVSNFSTQNLRVDSLSTLFYKLLPMNIARKLVTYYGSEWVLEGCRTLVTHGFNVLKRSTAIGHGKFTATHSLN